MASAARLFPALGHRVSLLPALVANRPVGAPVPGRLRSGPCGCGTTALPVAGDGGRTVGEDDRAGAVRGFDGHKLV